MATDDDICYGCGKRHDFYENQNHWCWTCVENPAIGMLSDRQINLAVARLALQEHHVKISTRQGEAVLSQDGQSDFTIPPQQIANVIKQLKDLQATLQEKYNIIE